MKADAGQGEVTDPPGDKVKMRRRPHWPGRRIGMRLWLGAAFSAVTLITAGSVFLAVNNSSGRTLRAQAGDLAVGRTASLADSVGNATRDEWGKIIGDARSENFSAALVNERRTTIATSGMFNPDEVTGIVDMIDAGLNGRRARREDGMVTFAAAPVFAEVGVVGVVISSSTPPPLLQRATDGLRKDIFRAILIATVIGLLVGFVVSTLITIRIKRLANSAERMAAGSFETPLAVSGGDEIGDLARSLEVMRDSLRDSFNLLGTERDRLSATLDGLSEAVMLVGGDGEVRFSNPAAGPLMRAGRPVDALDPILARTREAGIAEQQLLEFEGRMFAAQGRRLDAESAALLVVRDRTEESKRDQAEREFVSNAAHELRNPLAAITGVLEVLNGGAKDDPTARERFLDRLTEDTERMTRLTQALLTLARVEAQGTIDSADVVDIEAAIQESIAVTLVPDGLEIVVDVRGDPVSQGDPLLVRQVLIGLLSNACKHTAAPGTVTLRAFAEGERDVVTIEVEDTGTGIAAEEQARVFERFYRSESARDEQGFGLGLAIAKRMVDVMGGDIGVRSLPGTGSTFWIRLPVAKPTPTPVA